MYKHEIIMPQNYIAPSSNLQRCWIGVYSSNMTEFLLRGDVVSLVLRSILVWDLRPEIKQNRAPCVLQCMSET